jgi:NodT family efflux transporter outer membrane factor (OMF) lipoprotein
MNRNSITTRCLFVFISTVILLAGAGCTAPKATQADRSVDLPRHYESPADTGMADLAPWKLFYTSPYLNSLIDTVLASNYDLLMATQRIRVSQAMVRQARAPLSPQVNAAIVPSIRKFGLYTMDGAGNIVTDIEAGKIVPTNLPDFLYGFQASWEVDLWGKLKSRKKAAISRYLATVEGKNLVQTALVAETASAYYELQSDDQVLRMLEQTIALQEEALKTVRVQKEAALVNELAVQQFEAQLLGMKSLRLEMQQKIVEHESRINFLAGRFVQGIPRDSSFFIRNAIPVVQVGIPAALLRNRPDIRQAEWELAASKADLAAARAAFLPSLTITGGLGLQAYRNGLIFALPESIAYSLIAGLTAPVVNRNMIKAEFARADAQQIEAIYQYRKAFAQGYFEVYRELNNIRNLAQIYENRQQETALLSSSIRVSNDLFRTGRANYLEVLLARQNALRSNIELINTRKNQYLAAINLFRALGGGWR